MAFFPPSQAVLNIPQLPANFELSQKTPLVPPWLSSHVQSLLSHSAALCLSFPRVLMVGDTEVEWLTNAIAPRSIDSLQSEPAGPA